MAFKTKDKKYFERIHTDEPIDDGTDTGNNEMQLTLINVDENKEKANIITYYKSLNYSTIQTITSKEYKYCNDFDNNGIMYAIGTNFNSEKTWLNPSKTHNNTIQKIILKSYPNKMYGGTPSTQSQLFTRSYSWQTFMGK
eukprot:91590_1